MCIRDRSKADRDEVHQKVEQRLKAMREDLTKTMKSQQTRVVRCGGYKEEPENLVFSGNPHENPVAFLRLFEACLLYTSPQQTCINTAVGDKE